jgi:nucleotide-binding universal stress UspA family protein
MIAAEECVRMWTIERILCPVDLSDPSRRALNYAVSLAREHGASVHAVHVVDMGSWIGITEGGPAHLVAETETRLREQFDEWLSGEADGAASSEVVHGPVVAGILDVARERRSDLIVIGTHGRSGFERLALGSVAEKVLRKSTCPVLVVPAREEALVRGGRLGRIVYATDCSEPAMPALACARRLAEQADGPVSLLTVIDWPFGESSGPDPVTQLRKNLETEAAESLRQLGGEFDGMTVDIVVRRGKAAREIVAYAAESHAELIVIGVSGRGAIDRALLGSTAHQVLRDTPCPVLTVPASTGQ